MVNRAALHLIAWAFTGLCLLVSAFSSYAQTAGSGTSSNTPNTRIQRGSALPGAGSGFSCGPGMTYVMVDGVARCKVTDVASSLPTASCPAFGMAAPFPTVEGCTSCCP